LLSYCVENQRHESGRDKELIRAFPTHYMSAWTDLPQHIGNLRQVPEMLVGLLADQKDGEFLDPSSPQKTWFPVGATFQKNLFLRILGPGMAARALQSDLNEDFDETTAVGVDQLLTIRIAQQCGGAPKRLAEGKGSSQIPNQHPIARQAARTFNDDLRLFLQSYGRSVPRQSLLPMLESCMSLGLANLLLSTARTLFEWEQTGTIPKDQLPWPLFVDCSNSADHILRRLAEESLEDAQRRLRRFPIVLMALRILSYKARLRLKTDLPVSRPDATARINCLGEILHRRHPQSHRVLDDLDELCASLAEKLDSDSVSEDVAEVLRGDGSGPNPAMRLAEAVTLLMGDKLQIGHIMKCLNSCLMLGDKNGLAVERRVTLRIPQRGKKTAMARSIVLSNTVLDFAVHRHLRRAGKKGATKENPLSFSEFLQTLRMRYGLYVDQAPPGQQISVELLLENRRVLEGRLRDLGLLVGVNDSESMKRLRPRFEHAAVEVEDNGHDL